MPQTHYLDRFTAGLYTNRSPIYTPKRVVGMSVIPQNDVLTGGIDCEITPQDTLARRPGYPDFCSVAFGVSEWPLALYGCRLNSSLLNFVDSQTDVATFTSSAKTSIFTKSTTARSYFQQVGDLLYFSDGTTNKKYDGTTVRNNGITAPTAAPSVSNLNFHDIVGGVQYVHGWSPNYSYAGPSSGVSTFWLKDPNGNIQIAFLNPGQVGKSANSAPTWSTTTGGTTVDGSMLWTNSGSIGSWAAATGTPTFFYTAFNAGVVKTFSAGPNGPTTYPYTQDSSGTVAWSINPLSSNTLRTAQSAGNTNVLSLTGFGFAIPAAATITGIEVFLGRANKFAGLGSTVVDKTVKLIQGGVISGTNKAKTTGNWPSSYTVQNYGSNADVWGLTVSPGDINASNFGVSVSCTLTSSPSPITAPQAYLLSVQVKVSYTLGSVSNAFTSTVILDTNGNLQRIKTLGTTGGSAPVWSTTIGGTTTDNTTTWECMGSGNQLAALYGWDYAYGFHTTSGTFSTSFTGDGHLSTMSPFLSLRAPLIGNSVTLTGYGSSDTQVDRNDLYRNQDGGSVLFYCGSENNVDGSTLWTHIDATQDVDLDQNLVGPIDHANDPPVAGISILAYHMGRMWGASGNSVYFTAGPDCTNGDPNQSWPGGNVFEFPSTITALAPIAKGLLVFTQSSLWIILGGPQTLTFYAHPLLKRFGVLSANCVVQDADMVYVYTSSRQLFALSLSSKEEIGFPIADQLKTNFNPSTSCLAVHRAGHDQGLFISDGSTNVYRMSLTSGAWSPVAQPVGGVGILDSVETSTGVYTLLAGRPTGSGKLLGRSITNFVDGASSTYSPYATFGGIVLTAPGTVEGAIIKNFVLEYTTAGTDLTLSVLPNETSGSFTTIPFTVADNWRSAASSTIKMRRHDWTGVQSALANSVKHLQIKVTMPTENAKNELLGLAFNVQ